MRGLSTTIAVTALFVFLSVPAFAGEPGNPPAQAGDVSSEMLADMGLAGMEVLSDDQVQMIRGKGFTFAFSWSWVGNPSNDDFNFTFNSGQFVSSSKSGGGAFTFGGSIAWAN